MARKKKEEIEEESGLTSETKKAILAIGFFVLAIFFFLALRGSAGVVGALTYRFFGFLLGSGYLLLPILLVLLGVSLFRPHRPKLATMNIVGGILFIVSGLGIVELIFGAKTGGIIGWGTVSLFLNLFGRASWLILAALFLISLIVIFDSKLSPLSIWARFKERRERKRELSELGQDYDEEEDVEEESEGDEEADEDEPEDEEEYEEEDVEEEPKGLKKLFGLGSKKEEPDTSFVLETSENPYVQPPLSLLGKDSGKPGVGDIKANSNIIKRTLANFNVQVEMDEISIGPSITRYALKPAEGIKLSKIVGLQNELSLALAAHPLRVEAPIPGKSLVGIEVPNTTKTTIRLGSLLSDKQFLNTDMKLPVAIGKGISGIVKFIDIAKLPHMLIAGTTGSGKSVTIHAIITSLLYKHGPGNLRLILVDPKRVELTLYNNIPHLLTPVITQAKKAILALKWAANEMDRRYDILEAESARDIHSYHLNVLSPALEEYNEKLEEGGLDEEGLEMLRNGLPDPMPYIVIVIDELADIMTTYPRELEAAIVRLAQMSRAVGIHLILSTQRPSTEIITGLIKANVPSRIALQVPSQIDSRTIIDMPGAEKLLGSGDMLYLGSEMSKPQRFQSAYITEEEVKKVVNNIVKSNGSSEDNEDTIDIDDALGGDDSLFSTSLDDSDDDELYEEAREVVISMKRASTSLLQRKLKVGYARAARLIDMLEERGVVGEGAGSKPREVYADTPPKGGRTASDEFAAEFDKEKEESEDDEEYEEE